MLDALNDMQPAYGQLTSLEPRLPKPLYVLIEGEDRLSLYSSQPPFDLTNLIGYVGASFHIRRIKRGLLFSTFEVTTDDDHDISIRYMTDNKFGDLLALFTPPPP